MARKEIVVEEIQKMMGDLERIRNIAIVAHVDHGKTTLSDSLVARAGLISKELAGSQRVLDYDIQEQMRGITIKSADISLGFKYEGNDYLINLIDTPGHVDFGGHVTRAMRAVDGVVVVIDAVEGIMPQTETVLRQALRERAKPVVFVNKVDRLINELKLNQEQMVAKLVKIITGVNKIIAGTMPPELKGKKDWSVSVEKGNIAFGSAFHKWAVSITSMKQYNISFKEIYDRCDKEDHAYLVEKSPVDSVLLEMVIKHLPNPKQAQPYRIPILWKYGDLESKEGKSMIACDSSGPAIGVCFGIVYDNHAGEVGVVRLFSGSMQKGDQIYISSKKKYSRVQQVGVYMGPDRVAAEKLSAGNIGSVVGLKDLFIGETISSEPMEPFEQIKHYSQPVVTKSIEAKNSKDLAKLIEVLRGISKEDPTVRVELNQETGEHLISGMGELHLEIIEYKIAKEKKIDIITSAPIVVYLETIAGKYGPIEGKSPNKHNKLKIIIEPLDKDIIKAILDGEIQEGKPKGKELVEKLVELGMERDEAKNIWDIYHQSMFINGTKGIQYLNEIQELVIQGFEDVLNKGPLAAEKINGIKVTLVDATLHEDNIHRGPAQIIPTIRRPLLAGILLAGDTLLEPQQKVLIHTPQDYAGDVLNLTNGRRGQLISMEQEGDEASITTVLPVSEMFGFSNLLRGATQGRAVWYQEYAGYHKVPKDLVPKIVKQVRTRKGLPPEVQSPEDILNG